MPKRIEGRKEQVMAEIECPVCAAPPGKPCENYGRSLKFLHLQRRSHWHLRNPNDRSKLNAE